MACVIVGLGRCSSVAVAADDSLQIIVEAIYYQKVDGACVEGSNNKATDHNLFWRERSIRMAGNSQENAGAGYFRLADYRISIASIRSST